MMVPEGVQHMGHIPHFPSMGMGMGIEQGPVMPSMNAMASPTCSLSGQGLPLPFPCTPPVPFSDELVMRSAVGPDNAHGVPVPMQNEDRLPVLSGKELVQSMNKQNVQNTSSSCLTKQQSRSKVSFT